MPMLIFVVIIICFIICTFMHLIFGGGPISWFRSDLPYSKFKEIKKLLAEKGYSWDYTCKGFHIHKSDVKIIRYDDFEYMTVRINHVEFKLSALQRIDLKEWFKSKDRKDEKNKKLGALKTLEQLGDTNVQKETIQKLKI